MNLGLSDYGEKNAYTPFVNIVLSKQKVPMWGNKNTSLPCLYIKQFLWVDTLSFEKKSPTAKPNGELAFSYACFASQINRASW